MGDVVTTINARPEFAWACTARGEVFLWKAVSSRSTWGKTSTRTITLRTAASSTHRDRLILHRPMAGKHSPSRVACQAKTQAGRPNPPPSSLRHILCTAGGVLWYGSFQPLSPASLGTLVTFNGRWGVSIVVGI